ncbi:MAG: SMP-30/gluconolactonase/LRE family protein [Chitinophagaceae bacterium]|nr:SMP-30/gluconolactonase/LRE family protein [Chitinophagaceae bacterium]MCW5929167.1 SMP-30/gluconolactonase/LRE family protein [Chitinophagaceae bacterium]
MKQLVLIISGFLFTASFQAQDIVFDSLQIIAPGATLKEIGNQFSFTEGPAADKKGNVFFTDQPNNKIWKYDVKGKLELFMNNAGRSNGLYFDKKGNIIACADENNELWQISPDKKITVLLKGIPGKRHNGPNDLWLDAKGGIYFTDPYYQRPYWERKEKEIEGEKVYYLPKGSQTPVAVADDLKRPNGIIGTPDGQYLYVADIGDNKTYRFTINADGSLSDKRLLAEQGSDGITLDNQGNLYLSGRGVTVYNRAGVKIAWIPVPSGWVGNITFGGKKRNQLFITASKSVFTLDMEVKGAQ